MKEVLACDLALRELWLLPREKAMRVELPFPSVASFEAFAHSDCRRTLGMLTFRLFSASLTLDA